MGKESKANKDRRESPYHSKKGQNVAKKKGRTIIIKYTRNFLYKSSYTFNEGK